MRKTRLVILPTKCLHQMGFLLLFLSCPVIGDWGRIRPESEDSHNAIQIDREGTCGMERDPPGGLIKFLDEDGSKQCRLSEDLDANPVMSGERRVDVRRINTRRTSERRVVDERRGLQRDVRSRSLESRRLASRRNDVRARSLSPGRVERERERRSAPLRVTRQHNAGNSRRETERLQPIRRTNDRRSEQERRLSVDRRERTNRNVPADRRERETTRLSRSQERERQETRRDDNRRSIQEQSRVRDDVTRRQERIRTERRLSPVRRETNDRRTPELRRSLEFVGRKPENLARNDRRETENFRRFATPKPTERDVREREAKSRRESRFLPKIEAEYKKAEDEGLFAGITKRMDLKSYDGFNVGDWTTNCVIGAVVYFFTTRQIKSV